MAKLDFITMRKRLKGIIKILIKFKDQKKCKMLLILGVVWPPPITGVPSLPITYRFSKDKILKYH